MKKRSKFFLLCVWLLAVFVYGFDLYKARHSYICDYTDKNPSPLITLQTKEDVMMSLKFLFGVDGSFAKEMSDPGIYRWNCVDNIFHFYDQNNATQTFSIIHAEEKINGDIAFLTSNGFELIVPKSILSKSFHFLLMAIILIFPFLFFLILKSILIRTLVALLLLFISILYYQHDFASSRIFYHYTPTPIRLFIISSISGLVIGWARGIGKKFDKIDFYLILYSIFCVLWISTFVNSFWISSRGIHWFYVLNGFLHGTFEIGKNLVFEDWVNFKGNSYPPYPYGSVIFNLFFGAQIKFSAIIGAVTAMYFYLRIYKFAVPSQMRKLTVAVILSMVFLAAVLFSGTFYAYPPLGSSLFLGAALFHYFVFKKEGLDKDILMAAVFLLIATLFRIEVILAFVFILVYETLVCRQLKTIKILSATFIISVALYLLQNYLKFDHPFQTGYSLDPAMDAISIKNLKRNIPWYFFDTPEIHFADAYGNSAAKYAFLYFSKHIGGYFTLKYIGLTIGLGIWLLSLFTKGHFVTTLKGIFLTTLKPINYICLSCGLCIFGLFLMGFSDSQYYDMIYMPILIVSGFYFLPRSNIFNFFLLMIVIWMHLGNLFNYSYYNMGWMF